MSSEIIWTAAQAADATGGEISGEWSASGISIDSRSLRPGDLFVALEGPNFDGHDYIAQAFRNGAVAALTHHPRDSAKLDQVPDTAALLVVEDSLIALRRLGAKARDRCRARFIGITGSLGKTSTKEALARCLGALAPTGANPGSFNNHWGLPLSLARLARGLSYGVFELGMNHPGEIRDLVGILRPEVAVVTNVEEVHIGHFDSLTAIADAKAEIFEGMVPGGTAVLNRDNRFFEHLVGKAKAAGVERIIGFGHDKDAEVRLVGCTLEAGHSDVEAEVAGQHLAYRLPLPGSHWVSNSLAVLAAAVAAGADATAVARGLTGLKAIARRGERTRVRLQSGAFELIDDSYNASPASMRAAFEVLGRAEIGPEGRRIAALGDMLELGSRSAEIHADLAPPLEAAGVDLVFACGVDMAELMAALPSRLRGAHAVDSGALAPLVAARVRDRDSVLVKGSAGSRMAVVVEALKALAQDAETARETANGDGRGGTAHAV